MLLDLDTLPAHAKGCAILGAGGGGSPTVGMLAAMQAIEDCGPVELVDLDDLDDDALLLPCGMVGAPTVTLEKLGNGWEGVWLRERVEQLRGRPVEAVMCTEIGGANGCEPIAWAARMGLPMVDADGMGRAFPEMPQVAMQVAGIQPEPCVVTDERGNVCVFYPSTGEWLEFMCRAASVSFGGRAASTEYHMTAKQARTSTVRGTVSLATRIGRTVMDAPGDPVQGLLELLDGVLVIQGKITDVERKTVGGFVRGSVVIEGLQSDGGRMLRLELQNENLVALEDGAVRASVPDIITVLDTQTAEGISTELLRYGQRVSVIAFACDPLWRSPAGLKLAGPRAFGYDFDYEPIEELRHVSA
jgi:DUF917 family protein